MPSEAPFGLREQNQRWQKVSLFNCQPEGNNPSPVNNSLYKPEIIYQIASLTFKEFNNEGGLWKHCWGA